VENRYFGIEQWQGKDRTGNVSYVQQSQAGVTYWDVRKQLIKNVQGLIQKLVLEDSYKKIKEETAEIWDIFKQI
jgi:hypothetical protein